MATKATNVTRSSRSKYFTSRLTMSSIIIWFTAGILIFVGIANFKFLFPRALDLGVPFQVTVGPEEVVLGPTANYADTFFNTVKTAAGLTAFRAGGTPETGGAKTYRFTGSSLENLTLASGNPVLTAGAAGSWDEGGAWLNSVHQLDERHWLGWYHGESSASARLNKPMVKSMGFTESFDGGVTWQKPSNNQPTNQVITGDREVPIDQSSYGDGKVMKIGEFYYMFINAPISGKVELARSSAQNEGRPGTWYKYYNGAWDEPGIGGKSSAPDTDLVFTQNFLSFNTYLNRYLAIVATGRFGFLLAYSSPGRFTDSEQTNPNIFSWDRFPVTIIPPVGDSTDRLVDAWTNPGVDRRQIYGYASIIGVDGDNNTSGQSFYLYYMKVFEGDNLWKKRYVMRRKITLEKDQAILAQETAPAKIAFMKYTKSNAADSARYSIDVPKLEGAYVGATQLGYILPYSSSGTVEMHECLHKATSAYFSAVLVGTSSTTPCSAPADPAVRRLGSIFLQPTEQATKPLYQCARNEYPAQYVTTQAQCAASGNAPMVAGYIIHDPSLPDNPIEETPPPVQISPDQQLANQYFKLLIGSVPPESNAQSKEILKVLNNQGCKAAVLKLMTDSRFINGKRKSLSNLEYAKLMYKVTMSRTPSDTEAKPWSERLRKKTLNRTNIVNELYKFSEPNNACRNRKLL